MTASDGVYSDKVEITWSASADVSSYEIFRAATSNGEKVPIGSSTTLSFNDTTVVPGVPYWFFVKACNLHGCSEFSVGDTGYASAPIPVMPGNVSATDGDYTDKVIVTWDAVNHAFTYQIMRSDSETGDKTLLGEVGSLTFADNTTYPGKTYYYWVKACHAGGCGSLSLPDTGYAAIPVPAIPTGISASDGIFNDKVHVGWLTVDWASSYQVFRADTVSGSKTQLGTVESAFFADTTVVPGNIYWYFIKACSISGCSDFSVGDSGYAMLETPDIPSGVSASDGTYTDKVLVSWNVQTDASNYQVFRAITATGAKTQIGTSENTSFEDFSAVQGRTYWYFVKACNATGCSAISEGDSGFAAIPVPDIPNDVAASDGTFTDRVQINWTQVSGANHYQVFRADQQNATRNLIGTSSIGSFDDTNTIIEKIYWYWIKACQDDVCSDFSFEDSGFAAYPVLDPPAGLRASDGVFIDKIEIAWNSVFDTEQYKVYRSDSENGSKIEIATTTDTVFLDLNIEPGVTYWYFAKACNLAGCSEFSFGDSGYATLLIPERPENLEASDGTFVNAIKLRWSSTPRATNYEIYRALSNTEAKLKIAEIEKPEYLDTDVEGLIKYWYWVKACNASGCSIFSEPDDGFATIETHGYTIWIPLMMKK
ncbi:MAG TPA: hypothetical protein GXX60_06580 [Anaerolineaceae bacterium]|nr:hypothetical protein [Anaerolineaceae bacterium]